MQNGRNHQAVRHGAMGIAAFLFITSSVLAWQSPEKAPDWIWSPTHQAGHVPQTSCFFRKTFSIGSSTQGTIAVAADDAFELFVNGTRVGAGSAEHGIQEFTLPAPLHSGINTLAVLVTNRQGNTGGLALQLRMTDGNQRVSFLVSDASWHTSINAPQGWQAPAFRETRWPAAQRIAHYADFSARLAASRAKRNTPLAAGGERIISRLPASGTQVELPAQFVLEQLAGHNDIGSAVAMTFNEFGQLIVAREDGMLHALIDTNGDGRLDTVRSLGQLLKTCQGLLAVNGELIATGQGDAGLALYRLQDQDRDGKLDNALPIVRFRGDNLEHGPHGVTLGPDGLIYVVVGNHSPLLSPASSTSPYRHAYEGDLLTPRYEDPSGHAAGITAPGGYVVRTDLSGANVETFAGGLRNVYDLAFNAQGELFLHDSDMESDQGTTWYRPTRVYHVLAGSEFGWRSGWANWPDYYQDVVPGIADTGRGSPTGIVVYGHRAFPAPYRQAIFSADWSEGRVWVIRPIVEGGSYRGQPEVFLQGKPLNVTDLDVGPDGALYLITGGRGTQGNVYRVAHQAASPEPLLTETRSIEAITQQPQFHSSWARQQAALTKRAQGEEWTSRAEAITRDVSRPVAQRVESLQWLQWIGPKPSVELLVSLSGDRQPELRQLATYYLGLQPDTGAGSRLQELLHDPDTTVRRRACESIARRALWQPASTSLTALRPLLISNDRAEAWAARRLLEQLPRDTWSSEVLTTDDQRLFLAGGTALVIAAPTPEVNTLVLQRSLQFMAGFVSDENFVKLLRVQQLALHRADISEPSLALLRARLADEYPSSSFLINRELIRLLVSLDASSIMDRYLAELQRDVPSAESIHLAMHLSHLKSGWNTATKMTLFDHLTPTTEQGSGVPGYLQNAAAHFGKTLTAEEITALIHDGSGHQTAALAAILRLPEKLDDSQRQSLIDLDRRLATVTTTKTEVVRRIHVAIAAMLARDGSDTSRHYLRTIFDRDPDRRVEVGLALAEDPTGANWEYVVRSLPLLEPDATRQVLAKIKGVKQTPQSPAPYRSLLMTAQRLGADGGGRDALALLEQCRGVSFSGPNIPFDQSLQAWRKWFQTSYPQETLTDLPAIARADNKWDEASLLAELTRAEQQGLGSVARGQAVFTKAQCAQCHRFGTLGESMGPDLTTVSRRFRKAEIVESIVQPSRVISDQYAAKVVVTEDGRTYTGLVAAQGDQELVILQSNGTKTRLARSTVDTIDASPVSAMPAGLLDSLTAPEIADLFAFLLHDPSRMADRPTARPTR